MSMICGYDVVSGKMPGFGVNCVILAFPGHTHFLYESIIISKFSNITTTDDNCRKIYSSLELTLYRIK